MHTTIEAAGRIMSIHDELVRTGSVPADAITSAMLYATWFFKKSHNVFRYRSKYFDRPLMEGKQADLKHSVLDLPNQAPVIAVSSLFSTSHTNEGDIIGPTLNILPLDRNTTVVILSCPMEQEKSVEASLSKMCQADDELLRFEISKLIIQRIENFVLSPAHFASWSAEKRKRIVDEFQRSLVRPEELKDHTDLDLLLF
jgi:hypothetical protein